MLALEVKRTVQGVGHLGVGEHRASVAGKRTRSYTAWTGMLGRCYSENCHERQPTYRDATVCPYWLNYQNFAEWFTNEPNSTEKGFQLDKDLILAGNREYGPLACSYVPRAINTLLVCRQNATGLPIGVSAFRSRYRSSLGVHGVLKHLGTYDTPSEARSAYVVAKEHYVKLLAEDYKQVLHPDVYTHLINWRARWQVLT